MDLTPPAHVGPPHVRRQDSKAVAEPVPSAVGTSRRIRPQRSQPRGRNRRTPQGHLAPGVGLEPTTYGLTVRGQVCDAQRLTTTERAVSAGHMVHNALCMDRWQVTACIRSTLEVLTRR